MLAWQQHAKALKNLPSSSEKRKGQTPGNKMRSSRGTIAGEMAFDGGGDGGGADNECFDAADRCC